MYHQRLNRLGKLLHSSGFDALALNPGPTLTYLTGMSFHLMERPVIMLITSRGRSAIILAELEAGKAKACPIPLEIYTYADNPATWPTAFQQAFRALDLEGKTIGVEPTRLRVLELRYMEAAAVQGQFISAEPILTDLRIQKDEFEISAMHQAVRIAQQALEATLPLVRVGISERELAAELSIQLLRAGSESEMPFAPIVASGPHSANPHASPTDRKLQAGDLVVIDWGATFHGYCSDLTRTLAIGKLDSELERIYQVVLEANTAGRAACRPGIPAGQVDQATRAVIHAAGYGEFFIHRTGHGLGIEDHEAPYIFAENPLILAEGMTFTIEPGIYLPGRGGVRIEDDMVVTATGAKSLSDFNRELITLKE